MIFYNVATWLSAIIAIATAIAYFARPKVIVDNFRSLGYPDYLPALLGVWKALGAIALIAPVPHVVREWAYAGFTFNYTGAAVSHLACKEYAKAPAPLIVLAILAVYISSVQHVKSVIIRFCRQNLRLAGGSKRAIFLRAFRTYAPKKGPRSARARLSPNTLRDPLRSFLRHAVDSATQELGASGCLMMCVAPLVDDAEVRQFLLDAAAGGAAFVRRRTRADDASGDAYVDARTASQRRRRAAELVLLR